MKHMERNRTALKVPVILNWLFPGIAGLIHALLLILFLEVHLMGPCLLCLGGLILHTSLLLLCRRHRRLTMIVGQVEVCLCSILLTQITGWGTGFYFYIIGMLASVSYIGRNAYVHLFPLQIMNIGGLALLLAVRPYSAIHFNGMDTSLDWIYASLFAANLMATVLMLTVCITLFSHDLDRSQAKLLDTNKRLEYLATHDELTGLQNRRSMNELLTLCRAQAERSSIPFVVAMGDIDNFKRLNDTYGHNYGDQVLTLLAETIQHSTREGDFVCRWGGEEILILFSATRRDAAKSVLLRGQDKLRHPGPEGQDILLAPVTMTFGLSEYKSGQSVSELIERADERLYQGKSSGKNCIIG